MIIEHSSKRIWRGKRIVSLAGVSVVAAALAALLVSPSPARANCYELIGCTNKSPRN
jgi:hypothetical protein